MIPTGIPEYGADLGVSFDDPLNSLSVLFGRIYPQTDKQIREDPEKFQRFLNLAAEPRGVSCEFCCGIGAIGASKNGKSRCGCQHNPALLGLTQWLILNTDYTDAEVLKEVMKWKSLWFPKNMIQLAMSVSGGDTSVLADMPSMVGGC